MEKSYIGTTKLEELERVLGVQGIKLRNFVYEFSFSEGSHRLSFWMTTTFLLANSRAFSSGSLWRTSLIVVSAMSLTTDEAVAQLRRLCVGCMLILETFITTRNVFRYCLEGFSHNGWRLSNNQEVAQSVSALFEMKLHPFALVEFAQWVLLGIDQGSKDTSSGTDSISLRRSAQLEHRSKIRVDSVGVVTIVARASSPSNFLPVSLPFAPPTSLLITVDEDTPRSPSEEIMDTKVELARVHEQHRKMMEENKIIIKQNEDLIEFLAILNTKSEWLEREEVAERESKEALQAEFNMLTVEHTAKTYKIIQECQDQVASTIKEQLRVLEDFRKKIALMCYIF
ncbi:hypothetical protein GOBAR_AA03331 [Gossypium barbadense]|uniref:Uncharacterized protein n=1 Tax=Gossypium barbadense TaxID=3634 RepID=A0A2P5YNR9_GOSBA|nr:hypothetical protein GOBAR_AA03331 [Gossypium barbadense]